MSTLQSVDDDVWPSLPYSEWKPTLDTLHMWTQIVGKVKLALTPFLNDWWNITFFLTARGLSTSMIPFGQRVFQVDFDFIDHRLTIQVSDGRSRTMALTACAVADFYQEFMTHLDSLDIQVRINTHPVEVDNGIPFEADNVHTSYDPAFVNRWWRILVGVSRVMSVTAPDSWAKAALSSSFGAHSIWRPRATPADLRRRANGQLAGWRWAPGMSRRWQASGRATNGYPSRRSSHIPIRNHQVVGRPRFSPTLPTFTPSWPSSFFPTSGRGSHPIQVN